MARMESSLEHLCSAWLGTDAVQSVKSVPIGVFIVQQEHQRETLRTWPS